MTLLNALVVPFIAPGPLSKDRKDWEAPIQLANGSFVQNLPFADDIVRACFHRGFHFDEEPFRDLESFYCVACPLDEKERHRSIVWDANGAITQTIAMSRLVRPNAASSAYAGRVELNSDGSLARIAPLPGYRIFTVDADRHWLNRTEWESVNRLLTTWTSCAARNVDRITKAMWLVEKSFQEFYLHLRWLTLVTAIEALIGEDWQASPQRRGRGMQFRLGVEHLGRQVGIAITTAEAQDCWDLRSHVTHGQPNPPAPGTNPVIQSSPLYKKLESVALNFLRKSIEDDVLAANLVSETALRSWF